MPTQDKIGENDGVDAGGDFEDVSYEPQEKGADTPEERSDAQRVADGEIEVDDGNDEMFVSPDGAWNPEQRGEKVEAEAESSDDGDKAEKKETVEKPAKEKPEDKEAEKEEDKKKAAAAPDPVQKRINKITREKYDAIRRAEEAERKVAEREKELRELRNAKAKSDVEGQRPKAADFETEEDYHVALGRWSAKMEMIEAKAAEAKPKDEAAHEEDPRKRIIDLGQETFEDFIEVASGIPISKEMFDAMQDSDHAHEVVYYLGQHPEEAKAIHKLTSPLAIARRMGAIEAQFASDDVDEVVEHPAGEERETPGQGNKPKKKPSSSPPPIKPLGGDGKIGKKAESMSLAEYYESRGFTRDGMKKTHVMKG